MPRKKEPVHSLAIAILADTRFSIQDQIHYRTDITPEGITTMKRNVASLRNSEAALRKLRMEAVLVEENRKVLQAGNRMVVQQGSAVGRRKRKPE